MTDTDTLLVWYFSVYYLSRFSKVWFAVLAEVSKQIPMGYMHEKQNHLQGLTGKQVKKLRGEVQAKERELKDKDSEIVKLRLQLESQASGSCRQPMLQSQPVGGPSKLSKTTRRFVTPDLSEDEEIYGISNSNSRPARRRADVPGLNPVPRGSIYTN
ncbi:hypothetical protein B0H13DRAFT_1883121 [Mycena leptocephala]|nr:hypothetical protein B0H13DRAFT_1883121 [Mycena leptocephala]